MRVLTTLLTSFQLPLTKSKTLLKQIKLTSDSYNIFKTISPRLDYTNLFHLRILINIFTLLKLTLKSMKTLI